MAFKNLTSSFASYQGGKKGWFKKNNNHIIKTIRKNHNQNILYKEKKKKIPPTFLLQEQILTEVQHVADLQQIAPNSVELLDMKQQYQADLD